jgi:two-component system sensor histidine kinase HydH
MKSVKEAGKEDIRHTVIMGGILLLIGLTGIILLFITHNYRATKVSLSRIEAFSDNLVENMPIGLIAIDNHKRIASFNHVAESFFIHLTEANIGKDIAEIIPRELCQLIESSDIRKGIVEKEIDCPVNDGRTIPLEVSSTLLNDKDDKFLGYMILFKDMTEIKSLKKIIARSQRLASVGRLAAGVAHEIRNPLSSIKGFATYFKERYYNVSEDKQTAEIMIQEVDRLNRVVSQLLEFAKPVKVSARPADIRKLLEDSLKLIEKQIQGKNINIETDFSDEVEKAFIDSDKINQVLLNLYLNAIDALKDGGTISVLLRKHKWRKGIEVVIQDSGPGIDAKDLPNIFDPYFTTKSTGTGIGLAIVHNIIEAHNGEIKVESRPGEGTKFIVYLSDLSKVENET